MLGPATISDSLRAWLGRWKDNLTADPLSAFGFEIDLRGCVGLCDHAAPPGHDAATPPLR